MDGPLVVGVLAPPPLTLSISLSVNFVPGFLNLVGAHGLPQWFWVDTFVRSVPPP
jgi:hypothetical protein